MQLLPGPLPAASEQRRQNPLVRVGCPPGAPLGSHVEPIHSPRLRINKQKHIAVFDVFDTFWPVLARS